MSTACQELATELQRRVARMYSEFASAAVSAAEASYACKFTLANAEGEQQVLRAVNLALQQTASLWVDLLSGTTTVDEARPAEGELLPLICLGGSSPQSCIEAWHRGGARQYSATMKFELVADELTAVLGGIQVEFMQPEHVFSA